MPPAQKEAFWKHLDETVTSFPPAQRTLLVLVSAWEEAGKPGGWDHCVEVHPVIAIETVRRHDFVRYHPKSEEWPSGTEPAMPTCQSLLDAGWGFDGSRTRRFPVFVHPEDGDLVNTDEYEINLTIDAKELVPCTWPAEEDESRLAPIIEKLRPKAQKARRIAVQTGSL